MAFRWRADDGQILNAGLVALRISGDPVQHCLYSNPIFLCFLGGGGVRSPCSPSGSAHVYAQKVHLNAYVDMSSVDKYVNIWSEFFPSFYSLSVNEKQMPWQD